MNEGNLSDYNLLYRSKEVTIPFEYNWGEKRFPSLAEWQEKTGHDRHSVIARPLFANEARYDFRKRQRIASDDISRFASGDSALLAGRLSRLENQQAV